MVGRAQQRHHVNFLPCVIIFCVPVAFNYYYISPEKQTEIMTVGFATRTFDDFGVCAKIAHILRSTAYTPHTTFHQRCIFSFTIGSNNNIIDKTSCATSHLAISSDCTFSFDSFDNSARFALFFGPNLTSRSSVRCCRTGKISYPFLLLLFLVCD